jgi:hypothetical protein
VPPEPVSGVKLDIVVPTVKFLAVVFADAVGGVPTVTVILLLVLAL